MAISQHCKLFCNSLKTTLAYIRFQLSASSQFAFSRTEARILWTVDLMEQRLDGKRRKEDLTSSSSSNSSCHSDRNSNSDGNRNRDSDSNMISKCNSTIDRNSNSDNGDSTSRASNNNSVSDSNVNRNRNNNAPIAGQSQ